MTGDMRKILNFKNHDGRAVRVGNNAPYHIIGIGSITLDGTIHTNDAYFVDGLKHNVLRVGTNCNFVMTHALLRTRKENYLTMAQELEVMYFS